MRRGDAAELLGLAALWGGSFLFMRLGAEAFGPVALAGGRVAGAALVLLPLLCLRGDVAALRRHWRPIAVVGVFNSALPFLCFSFAAVSLTAGLSSIFNATSPLFAALVAWLWLKDRPPASRLAGLAIGFAGVLWLAASNVNGAASFKPGGSGWAVAACLLATASYGFAANSTERRLRGVAPLAVAAGSQAVAAIVLAVPSALTWPAVTPPTSAWGALAMLAAVCTGFAYVLYFRLIAHVGPGNAIAVTFLVPLFGVLWGSLVLGERLSLTMVAGCAVILAGTGLATGLVRLPPRRAASA